MNLRISALLPVFTALCLSLMAAGCAASTDLTEEEQQTPARDTVVVRQEGPSRDEMQQELDVMKTENVQLKEKLSAAEKTNRDLVSKASDLEASIAARDQASRTAEMKAPAKRSYEGVTTPEDARMYEAAVKMVKRNNCKNAIPKFESLLNTVKEDLAPNCRHWLGLAYFGLKDYKAALDQFNEVFAFKFSTKKDDAQFMIAQCYEKLGDRAQAKAEYQKFVKTYPTSEYIARAKKKANQ